MSEHNTIYQQQADQYDLLVTREDYQHNIFPALNQLIPLDQRVVVELGAGTGRLTCMLAPVVQYIYAFDGSQHMLDVAAAKLQHSQYSNWQLVFPYDPLQELALMSAALSCQNVRASGTWAMQG